MKNDIAKLLQHLELMQQVGQALNDAMVTLQHGLVMADLQINQLKERLAERAAWTETH